MRADLLPAGVAPAVAIVGLGAAGRRHAAVVRACLPSATVVALRRRGQGSSPRVDAVVHDVKDALRAGPMFAVLSGPSSTRLDDARPFVEAGVPVLLEKPIAADLAQARELADLIGRVQATALVGYNLRYHRPVRDVLSSVRTGRIGRVLGISATVGQDLRQWRPGAPYRDTVSARADAGGGVLLELSHELDLALSIGGPVDAVTCQTRSISDLGLDVEDSADLLLSLTSGAVANVHLDMHRHAPQRRVAVAGSRGTIELDLLTGTSVVTVDGVAHQTQDRTPIAQSYARQTEDFIRLIAIGAALDTVRSAVDVVAVVDAARRSAATGDTVAVSRADRARRAPEAVA